MENNNAIVCLTRGYESLSGYDKLIKRNQAIHQFFGDKYQVVIFHEGNINEGDKSYIKARGKINPYNIKFVSIKDVWKGGYEGMCRFHAYEIWNKCKEYDYILRIDEDCIITEMKQDPFEHIGDNVFLRSVYFDESHSETNEFLPPIIERETGVPASEFYNRKFVYTNVCLSSVHFWLQDEMNELLQLICLHETQRKYRFGDLPILGSLLNIYAIGKVGSLAGMTYYHESHNMTIKCDE